MRHAAGSHPLSSTGLQPCRLLRVPVHGRHEAQQVHGRRLRDASLRRVLREQYNIMLPQVPYPATLIRGPVSRTSDRVLEGVTRCAVA